ncbi:MAG TPA: class I SAM-dependent methyltransferase [Clostridiales bacterium]|nr:class I SAM-dependent methyltransferase [Clostridiales bacterium]
MTYEEHKLCHQINQIHWRRSKGLTRKGKGYQKRDIHFLILLFLSLGKKGKGYSCISSTKFILVKKNISEISFLEVGCKTGANILQFIRYGFTPDKITANELLPERVKTARIILPSSVTIVLGDASQVPFKNAPFDLILVSTVFSSILYHDFRKNLH